MLRVADLDIVVVIAAKLLLDLVQSLEVCTRDEPALAAWQGLSPRIITRLHKLRIIDAVRIRIRQLGVDYLLDAAECARLTFLVGLADAAVDTARRHHVVIEEGRLASVRVLGLHAFEALLFQFVVSHQLIRTAIVRIALVENVLADLIMALADVRIKLEELLHDRVVNLVVLVVDLLLIDVVQVLGQILLIPDMLLNFLQGNTLHRIRLKHAVDQVLHGGR